MNKWHVTQDGKDPADFSFLSLMDAAQVKASLIQYNGYDETCVVVSVVEEAPEDTAGVVA